MSKNRTTHFGFLFAIATLALLPSVGCMMTPGDGQHIGSPFDSVSVWVATHEPLQLVYIEALHPTKGWQPIGSAFTDDYPVLYSGNNWYLDDTSVVIPSQYWTSLGNGDYSAQLRAVDYNDGPMYTFEEGFFDWFDPAVSLADMWKAHGHGKSITVYSTF